MKVEKSIAVVDAHFIEENGYTSLRVNPKFGDPFLLSTNGKMDHQCNFANFGGWGRGYLFVHPDPENPSGKFLWQC